MVTKVLRVKAKAPRLRFPVSLGERAWIDPIVIGRSGPGDHCQITLERRTSSAGRGPAVAGFLWPAAAGRDPRRPGEPAAHPCTH